MNDKLTVFLKLFRNLLDCFSPQARIVEIFPSGFELDLVIMAKGALIELVEFVLQSDDFILKIQEKAVVEPGEFAIDQEARISSGESCDFRVADDVMVHCEDKYQDSI